MELWLKLCMLPRCILRNSSDKHHHWRKVLKEVQSRCRRWQAGDFLLLWKEASDTSFNGRSSRNPILEPEALHKANARRARRAVEDGCFKKAMQALSSKGIVEPSQEHYSRLLEKHPQSTPPLLSSEPPPQSAHIPDYVVLKSIKSFPNGTAPGPFGFRASYFKEAVQCPSSDKSAHVLQGITQLVNIIAAGKDPPSVVPHVCGANLLAFPKKDGGLRPNAVGEVLRRLTSKCLSLLVQRSATEYLAPLQLGVGVKGGCEAIVNSVFKTLEDNDIPPSDKWILLVDFSNAFNMIDRACIFEEFRAHIPSLSAWMESCYGSQPVLHFTVIP